MIWTIVICTATSTMSTANKWRETLCADCLKKKEWIKVLLGSKPWKKWAGATKKLVTAVNIATKCIIVIQFLFKIVTLIALHKTIASILWTQFAHKIVIIMTIIAGMLFGIAITNTEMVACP